MSRRRRHARRNPSTNTILIVAGVAVVGVGLYYFTRPKAAAASPSQPVTPGPVAPVAPSIPGLPNISIPPEIQAWLANSAIPQACRDKFGKMVPVIQAGMVACVNPTSPDCAANMAQLQAMTTDYQTSCAAYTPPSTS